MKRIALLSLLAALVALGVMSITSWRQDYPDHAAKPQPVLAVGVEIASTVDANQEQTIRSLARAGQSLADERAKVIIDYPMDGSIFPPEIVPPTFLWHDDLKQVDRWFIDVALAGGAGHIYILAAGDPPPRGQDDPRCFGPTNKPFEPTAYQGSAKSWTPTEQVWQAIKARSVGQAASVTIFGFDSRDPARVLSRGQMTLTTSADPVGAPIFYRDVPLMPQENDEGIIQPLVPQALPLIEWRLRDISRPDSRVLLSDMPTCANCHSFSADGQTLAMDIDGPSGDKGAYAISQIEQNMSIGPDEIITWNSFPDKPEGHKTIGFLSRISPDGRCAITTINETIYVANFTDYRYLQVFYPTGGILAYYSRDTREIKALPGADDPDYVHCDPVWSPDGKWIVFARARTRDVHMEKLAVSANDPAELKIQYDLYRIRFKDGRGGKPEPIEGASNNGMSNTFPKISPDGKWIVFVKCRNGQLMRPDSELWIVPLAGGEARRMTCNMPLENSWHPSSPMNSWHSFSPNSRWMVFSSKSNTPYTQMFLTHIDASGNDSPAILIPNATAANRAVNLPEFVNIGYDDLVSISAPSVDYYRYLNLGTELTETGQYEKALVEYRKALALEPTSTRINNNLAASLVYLGRVDEGIEHFRRCLKTDPRDITALINLAKVLTGRGKADQAIELYQRVIDAKPQLIRGPVGMATALASQGKTDEAIQWCQKALKIDPSSALAYYTLGRTYYLARRLPQAIESWRKTVEIQPDYAAAYSGMGVATAQLGDLPKAIELYEKALRINPTDVSALISLGHALTKQGQGDRAIEHYRKALAISPRSLHALNTLGIALARQGQVDEAIELFTRALEINPDHSVSRQNLNTALAQKNR